MIHTHPAYFAVTYRGVTVHVEPAEGDGQWEYAFDHAEHNDWHNLRIGNYPAVGLDTARAKAVEIAKAERPNLVASLHIELARIRQRLTELEAL